MLKAVRWGDPEEHTWYPQSRATYWPIHMINNPHVNVSMDIGEIKWCWHYYNALRFVHTLWAVKSCRALHHAQCRHRNFCLYSVLPLHQSSTNMYCLKNTKNLHFLLNTFLFIRIHASLSVTNSLWTHTAYRVKLFNNNLYTDKRGRYSPCVSHRTLSIFLWQRFISLTHRLHFHYEHILPPLSRFWWRNM